MVEHLLAKERVASSNLVFRSISLSFSLPIPASPASLPLSISVVVASIKGIVTALPGPSLKIPLVTLLAVFLLACGTPEQPPAPETRLPTAAAEVPTATSTPTQTPTPTATPTPIPTLTPLPSPETTSRNSRPVDLPADEGRHRDPVEWWYFNGHLEDEVGNDYSYHYVAFEFVTPEGIVARLLQYSWVDHGTGHKNAGEQFYLPQAGLPQPANAGPAPTPVPLNPETGSIDIRTGGLVLSGDGQEYSLAFQPSAGISVQLSASSVKPPLLHRQTGLVDLGPAGKTWYYTRPRLETSGTVTINDEARPVAGLSWMDHQWGDASTALEVGWDWLSLHLGDGADLMVSIVWEVDGREPIARYGTLSLPASGPGEGGRILHLDAEEITLTPTGSWSSPQTGGVYPMGWELSVRLDANRRDLPWAEMTLELTPRQEDSEFPPSPFVPIDYWEGAVIAEGHRDGLAVSGTGFVEMVGYAPHRALSLPSQAP